MPVALPSLKFPSTTDYQQVLQNPRVFLGDDRLKTCNVEKDPMGMPKVRSGGFALTYRLENGRQKYALRCFHKLVNERGSRYAAICKYISTHNSEILIPIEYVNQGVLVKGIWYPITIMDWVEGDSLSNYLYKNFNNRTLISNLVLSFLNIVSELKRLRIAHGDLSHLNILVRNSKMILIDYDGMFVPELIGLKSTEIGNTHFQHPRRNENIFNDRLDYFSEIVIYLTLKGLVLNPDLYNKYGKGGEGLIFKSEDFMNPYSSKLLAELENFPELSLLIRQFRSICLGDITDIPSFDSFLENQAKVIRPSTNTLSGSNPGSQSKILNATNRGTLLEHEGEYRTVIGLVSEIKQSITVKKTPYVFLNFGNYPKQTFTVVFWSEALEMLSQVGKKVSDYENQWVSVTGIIATYYNRVQIILESPTNIEIISFEEADRRLNEKQNDVVKETKPKIEFIEIPKQVIQKNPLSSVNAQAVFKAPVIQNKDTYSTISQPLTQPQKTITRLPGSPIEQPIEMSDKLNSLYSDESRFSKSISSSVIPAAKTNKKILKKKNFFERITEEIEKFLGL